MNNIFFSARDRKRLIAEFNGGSCSELLYVSGLQCLQCRLSYILAPWHNVFEMHFVNHSWYLFVIFFYLDSNEGIATILIDCVSRERMRFPTKPPKSPKKDAYPLENISSTQTKSKWCFVHIFLSIFATFLIIVAFVFCFVFCGSLGLHQCFKTDKIWGLDLNTRLWLILFLYFIFLFFTHINISQ